METETYQLFLGKSTEYSVLFSLLDFEKRQNFTFQKSSSKKKCDCEKCQNRPTLPNIPFLNLNLVLQRSFYSFCFPTLKRKFYFSSKTISNLAKRPPTTLIVENARVSADNFGEVQIQEISDFVVDVRGCFSTFLLSSNAFSKCLNFCVLNPASVALSESKLSSSDLEQFLEPKIASLVVSNDEIEPATTLQQVLERFSSIRGHLTYSNSFEALDGWEQLLHDWHQTSKLKSLILRGHLSKNAEFVCPNPQMLALFLRRQTEHFRADIHLRRTSQNYPEFAKYFEAIGAKNELKNRRVFFHDDEGIIRGYFLKI